MVFSLEGMAQQRVSSYLFFLFPSLVPSNLEQKPLFLLVGDVWLWLTPFLVLPECQDIHVPAPPPPPTCFMGSLCPGQAVCKVMRSSHPLCLQLLGVSPGLLLSSYLKLWVELRIPLVSPNKEVSVWILL